KMNEMVALKENFDTARRKVEKAADTVLQSKRKLERAVRKLGLLVKEVSLEEISSLAIDWTHYSRALHDACDAETSEAAEESEVLLSIVETCQTSLTTRKDNVQKALHQLTAIQTHVETIEEKTLDTERLSSLSARLAAILAVVEKQRKSYVEEVLVAI